MRLPPEVERMLAEAAIVRVATVTPSGAPSVAPFWFWYDAERIVLDTLENATVRNLAHEPRAAVLVDLGERFSQLRGAVIHGEARLYREGAEPEPVRGAI